jgi:hypothetical protein
LLHAFAEASAQLRWISLIIWCHHLDIQFEWYCFAAVFDFDKRFGRRACYYASVHATVQGPAVHHVTSLGGRKCIFKVQGPAVHHVTS